MAIADLPPLAPGQTLPDYLQPNLRLVLVGINPGYYSAQVGHYYARPGNLFWWALSNSGLVSRPFTPAMDGELLNEGIGLTDIVKRPTNSSGELKQAEFDDGRQATYQKLERAAPKVICFVGILGATAFLGRQVKPGPIKEQLGSTLLYTIPSTSRRNAHYGQDKILNYFKQLAVYVNTVTRSEFSS